jgi:nucleoside phosphorylase
VQQFPTAKGGEMEGAGLYAACQDKGVEWILIKSICDFADGYKVSGKREKQALAIETALHACLHVFNKKYVFESLGLTALQEV